MARLKSLNLRLKFHTFYNTHPVTIKHKGGLVNDIELNITRINQKEEIQFEGFAPEDITQQVTCTLKCNKREVHIQSIASFQMQDNRYVKNTVINNCKDVHFNGRLDLNFSKQWFKHNILAGANIDEDYVHWDQISFADEKVFCVGDSFTYGDGVARHETWPSLLELNAFNFGSFGLSHDGCAKNVKHILQSSKDVKQIICLLPPPTRKLFDFEFLGSHGSIPISNNSQFTLPEEFASEISVLKKSILKESFSDDWIKACTEIIDLCNEHKVECWISTWDRLMYEHIPKEYRLPIFPRLTTFTERAYDGFHPHKKHYELFVKNIKPYLDKTQS